MFFFFHGYCQFPCLPAKLTNRNTRICGVFRAQTAHYQFTHKHTNRTIVQRTYKDNSADMCEERKLGRPIQSFAWMQLCGLRIDVIVDLSPTSFPKDLFVFQTQKCKYITLVYKEGILIRLRGNRPSIVMHDFNHTNCSFSMEERNKKIKRIHKT